MNGAKTVLTKGRDGLQLSFDSSAWGNYISYTDDERMRNIESLGSYSEMRTGNMFQHVFTRMDLLSDADFETFSNEYISSLQKARVALDRANGLLKQASIETGYANHTNTWMRHSRTLPDILLLKVFESTVVPGLAQQTPLQRVRILKLMNRTISETDAMNDLKERILSDVEKYINPNMDDAHRPSLSVRITGPGARSCEGLFLGR